MKIAPPGGELSFWSAIWILLAGFLLYQGISTASPLYYGVSACVGLPAIGMWLGMRWSGYVFTLLCMLSVPLGLFALNVVDDTLGERAYRLFRLAMIGYFAWLTFNWARDG